MRKINLVLILVGLVLLLYWLINTQESKQTKNFIDSIKNEEMINYKPVAEQLKKVVPSSKLKSKKEDSIIPKARTFFNEDPFIDKLIIYSKYQYCFDLLSPQTTNSSLRLTYVYNKSSGEQKKRHLKEYRKICDKVAQQYPEYYLEKGFSFKHLTNLNATSVFGKRLHDIQFSQGENYTLSNKITDIKNTSPDLFLSINYLFYMDFNEVFKWDLYELLQTNNSDYIWTIYNYAQDLYACHQGADCGRYSTVVINKCILNDAFCVNDFETIVKMKLTKGQQADIAITYEYLMGVFDE